MVMGIYALLGLLFFASGLAAESSANESVHLFDWSPDLASSLSQLYDSRRGCDFRITVVGKDSASQSEELCAHSLILSLNSEAASLLRHEGNTSTVLVDEECLPYVDSFIRYLYTRSIEITLSSVKCFHKIASNYRATKLQQFCAQLFSLVIPEDPTFHAQLDLYNYALASQDPQLAELCLQFLAWNCEAFTESEAWLDLSREQLGALLVRSDVVVRDELSLLRALERWKALHRLDQHLIEEIRFPMIQPEDLFRLQFNLSFYSDFETLLQGQVLEALKFHTVSFQTMVQHVNLTEAPFTPRIYTSPGWTFQMNSKDYNYYYGAYQSFQTPTHPSFLFRSQLMSWNAGFHTNSQSCRNYGFNCPEGSFPLLSLNAYPTDPSIRYENKALMRCQGDFITEVQDFKDRLVVVPNGENGSLFPCPSGYSRFVLVIRPMYTALPDPIV
ncbi:galectin-3-binding protein-like [Lissotriton helveticus]